MKSGICDIVFFQETWLLPDQEETLPLPDDYSIIAMSHPARRLDRGHPWGGVAIVIRDEVPHTFLAQHSRPDLIALDLDSFNLIGGYVCSTTTDWMEWSDMHPEIALAESVVAACSTSKPLLLMGDMNGRSGQKKVPMGSELTRLSSDTKQGNARGKWFLKICGKSAATITWPFSIWHRIRIALPWCLYIAPSSGCQ